MFIENIVIGKPLVPAESLLANSQDNWEDIKSKTLFTNERFLPKLMKEIDMVSSVSEVRRNKPELMVELNVPDCFWLKWGKKRVYVIVGE